MFFKTDPHDTKPCPHMRGLVSQLADNALSGLKKWYTEQHVKGCPQCQMGLATICDVRDRLQALDADASAALEPQEWAQVEAGWQSAEKKTISG